MNWTIVTCEDCQSHFAVQEELIFETLACVICGSEDVTPTGEYLSGTLYTASGKVIQEG